MGRKKLTQDARKKMLTFRYGDEYLEAWYLLERKEEIVFNSSLSASAVAI